jgi:hypothetical protein
MAESISWVATIATIVAASMTSANLGSRITGYGFCVFLVGSISWFATGLLTGQPALAWTNVVLTVLNIFGIWRWLGRQARIEEGASSAADRSADTPGETLFPVSLLLRAPIEDRHGRLLGTCVDGMAGCSTGGLRYVVASQGGMAGVGETLRRVPWKASRIDSERLIADCDDAEFQRMQVIEKDQWPDR